MTALLELTLTQEELAYLLRLFKLRSLPSLPADWPGSLSEREMALVLGAGERSLRARGLLTYKDTTPILEQILAAIFGVIVQTRVGLVVNRMNTARTQSTLFCLTPTLKVAYSSQEGLFVFRLYETSHDLEEAVWYQLTGSQQTDDLPSRQALVVPMAAMLAVRLNTLIPDLPTLQSMLQAFQQEPATMKALETIFGEDFMAVCMFATWLTPDENQQINPQTLVQSQAGWWHMAPREEDYLLTPLTQSDLVITIQQAVSLEMPS